MPATSATRRRRGTSGGSGPADGNVAGDAPLSALLSTVQLSRAVVARLEARMKQQVRAAVDAQAAQQRSLALGGDLDAPWRAAGAVGCLRAFKMRGRDPAAGELHWPTTERSAADEFTINEESTMARTAVGGVFASAAGAAGVSRARTRNRMAGLETTGPMRDELDMQSFRVFGRVQGHFRDIVDAHYAANSADFLQQQRLLSPYVTDATVLRSIRASKDSYFGIKWVSETAPSSLLLSSGSSSSSAKRDCCFLEMVGFTADAHGREVGFVAIASVEAPECPPFPGFLRVARVQMQRTMLVRATDASLATSELFIMGESDDARSASSLAVNARLRVLMAVLNDVSLVIDSQNLVKQTLIAPQPWVPDDARIACSVCSRKFHFLKRRRHHCRLCGELVCKTCYVFRTVPCADFAATASVATAGATGTAAFPPLAPSAPARIRPQRAVTDNNQKRREDQGEVVATKFCVRCIMGLRAIDKRLDVFAQEISKRKCRVLLWMRSVQAEKLMCLWMLLLECAVMSISNASFLISDDVEASGVSTASSTSNLSTRRRGSSITYFKRGSNETREFNLDDLFEDHIKQAHTDDGNLPTQVADFTVITANDNSKTKGDRIGTTASITETTAETSTDWTAMDKKLRSVSEQPTSSSKPHHPLVIANNSNSGHSSSYGKLVRLSTLSRRSSSSKLLAELYDRGSVTVA